MSMKDSKDTIWDRTRDLPIILLHLLSKYRNPPSLVTMLLLLVSMLLVYDRRSYGEISYFPPIKTKLN